MPKYLTLNETAEVLRMHPKTLAVLARRGDIQSVRHGGKPMTPPTITYEVAADAVTEGADGRTVVNLGGSAVDLDVDNAHALIDMLIDAAPQTCTTCEGRGADTSRTIPCRTCDGRGWVR